MSNLQTTPELVLLKPIVGTEDFGTAVGHEAVFRSAERLNNRLSHLSERTKHHMGRVGGMMGALVIAHPELGIDRYYAALMGATHDIGKGNKDISELIESDKPLTPGQKDFVNNHALLGAKMIAISDIFERVRDTEAREFSIFGAAAHHMGLNYPSRTALIQTLGASMDNVQGKLKSDSEHMRATSLLSMADIFDALYYRRSRNYSQARLEQEGHVAKDTSLMPAELTLDQIFGIMRTELGTMLNVAGAETMFATFRNFIRDNENYLRMNRNMYFAPGSPLERPVAYVPRVDPTHLIYA